MNTKTNVLFLLMIVMILFTQCTGKQQGREEHDHDHAHDSVAPPAAETTGKPQHAVDENFQKQLAAVFASYVSLKDAFVTSDNEKVKTEGEKVKLSLSKTDMTLLTGAAHHDWMAYLDGMDKSLLAIITNKDIEKQREEFSVLSDNLYKSIKAFGTAGTTVYYDFCPMAFNNKGGYWLSDQEAIRNPYFGDKMLTCGSVEETLK